jgi:hypothetical protein
MHRWFLSRASRVSVSPLARRVRPVLEWLEDRYCPTVPGPGMASPVCEILNLTAVAGAGHTVQVSGSVVDQNPSACVVNLSGVVSGSVSVEANGAFSTQVTATGLGQVTAVAQDNQQQISSNQVSTQISAEQPVINNFAVFRNQNTTWTIQGQVADDQSAAAVPVLFGGPGNVQNMTVNTDANGNFCFAITINTAMPSFTITAVATDSWGLQSDLVSCTVNNS